MSAGNLVSLAQCSINSTLILCREMGDSSFFLCYVLQFKLLCKKTTLREKDRHLGDNSKGVFSLPTSSPLISAGAYYLQVMGAFCFDFSGCVSLTMPSREVIVVVNLFHQSGYH